MVGTARPGIRGSEVQEETSCRGSGGVPQFSPLFPQEWGVKGVEDVLRSSPMMQP